MYYQWRLFARLDAVCAMMAVVGGRTWVVLVFVQVIVVSGVRNDVKSREQFVNLQKRNSTVLCLLCHVISDGFKL